MSGLLTTCQHAFSHPTLIEQTDLAPKPSATISILCVGFTDRLVGGHRTVPPTRISRGV
jgi:hypothetical protein